MGFSIIKTLSQLHYLLSSDYEDVLLFNEVLSRVEDLCDSQGFTLEKNH